MIKSGGRYFYKKIKPFVKGLTAGVVVAVISLLIFAVAFYGMGAPDFIKGLAGYFIPALSSFVFGVFVGGGKERNGFLWGAVAGIAVFAVIAIISLVTGNFSGAFSPKPIIFTIAGSIGGIVGVNLVGERY